MNTEERAEPDPPVAAADSPAVSARPVEPAEPPAADELPAGLAPVAGYRRRQHYVAAAIIGLFVGLVAVAFRVALHWGETRREWLLGHLHETMPRGGVVVLPAIAAAIGLVVGLLVKFCPDSSGSGIPHLKGVLLGVRTLGWKRLIPVKFFGGVIGIGAGLSLGREGPTVQMGASLAQAIARLLRVPPSAVPQLLSCGAGAGLAAAFNAPLAGFIFVIEELHRELSTRTMIGSLIAAVTATAVSAAFGGQVPSFSINQTEMLPLHALPFAAVIGGIAGLVGVAFNVGLIRVQSVAIEQKVLPRWTLPAVAGAVVGLIAWWMPDAAGGGHEPAHVLLSGHNQLGLAMLAAWGVVKFSTTIFSYASGAPGGIFAPMLLLGAIAGAIVGKLAALAGLDAPYAQAFAVLGMAGVFTGSVRAPLTGIILISEMTANYQQLFALCVTCLTAQLVAEGLRATAIYDELMEVDLHRRGVEKTSTDARTVYLGIQRGAPIAGREIRSSGLPAGVLIVAIERHGRAIVPLGRETLHPGDHLTVAIPAHEPAVALDVARLCLPAD